MKCTFFVALSAMATFLTGCDTSQPPSQPPAKPHYQRFVPIAPEVVMTEGVPWHGFFALDTKTGTLCRTMIKDFGPGQWANDVPICSQLLATNPD